MTELVKVYQLDPRTRKKIKELWVSKKVLQKVLDERNKNLKRLNYV